MSHASRHDGPPKTGGGAFSPHSVRLAWILAVAYLLVIVYASLQPFQGWRVPPQEILHFLSAAWPRFITLQDVMVNVAAYVPLGLLLSIGWGARHGPARGALAAAFAAAALSLAMEAVQMFLPSRIASNVDLLANSLGALLGAMAAPLLAPSRVLGAKLHAVRHRLFLDGMVCRCRAGDRHSCGSSRNSTPRRSSSAPEASAPSSTCRPISSIRPASRSPARPWW